MLRIAGAINPLRAGQYTTVSHSGGSNGSYTEFSGGGNYDELKLGRGTIRLGANDGLSTSAFITVDTDAANPSFFDLNGFNQTLVGIREPTGTNPSTRLKIVNSKGTASTLTFTGNSND